MAGEFDFEPMSEEALTRIQSRATRASCAPWCHDDHIAHKGDTPGFWHVYERDEDDPPLATCPKEADARYIAVVDPATVMQILGELRAWRAAGLEAERVIEWLQQDIRDWTRTARGLRERSADPDRDPACPSQAGIDESERVLGESHAKTAKLRALVAHVGGGE